MVKLTFHKKSIKIVFFNDFGMFVYKKIILIYLNFLKKDNLILDKTKEQIG